MPQFDQRPRGFGIFRTATYRPGKVIADFPIEASSDVILHCDSKCVIIHEIEKQPDGTFKGTVRGVEPPGAEIKGLTDGDIVTFSEDQVISASKDD